MNQIETAEQLEEAAEKLKAFSGKRSAKVRADKNGEIELKNLETGVYLFVAEETKEYDRITPFLIALPTWNAESREMSYEVEVIPKHIPIVEKQEAGHLLDGSGDAGPEKLPKAPIRSFIRLIRQAMY